MSRTTAAALAAVLLLGLAGCAPTAAEDDEGVASLAGDGGPAEGASEGGEPDDRPTDPLEAALAYAACMREQGIDMEDPQVGPDGGMMITAGQPADGSGGGEPDGEAFEAADEHCQPHMEAVRAPGGGEGPSPEDQQRMLDFAACMREQGLDWPDPVFDGGMVRQEAGEPGDPEEVEAAAEACGDMGPGPVPAVRAESGR